MNIYLLRQRENLGKNLAGEWMDEMLACVIMAQDEEMARKIAATKALDEDHLGFEKDGNTQIRRKPSAWEDEALTQCLILGKRETGCIFSGKQMILSDTVHPS